jgi:hypothetical protein
MRRLFITSAVGGLVSIGTVFLEDSEDGQAMMIFTPIAGFICSAIFVALVLWPLRAVIRRIRPNATQRFTACVVGGLLLTLISLFATLSPSTTFTQGRFFFFAFFAIYVVATVASFFWPLRKERDADAPGKLP